MKNLSTTNNEKAWLELTRAYSSPDVSTSQRNEERKIFLAETDDRVLIIKAHIVRDQFWWLAYSLVKDLTPEERLTLLPELVHRLFNTGIGDLLEIYDLLLSLPKDALIAQIEALANPYLAQNDDQDWGILLTLCVSIDIALATHIASRAVADDAPEIREVGLAFFESLARH